MNTPAEITVVEPNSAAHTRINDYFATLVDEQHRFHLVSEIGDITNATEVDLAVIATDTRHRRAAWDELSSKCAPEACIFEKVLFPTIGDIEAVAIDLERGQTTGFVNCGRRGFPDYQNLADRFSNSKIPVNISVEGVNFGLASNAVHFLDLAEYLNGAELVEVSAADLDSEAQPSKRSGYIEIFGTLQGRLSNGASVSITCTDGASPAVQVGLTGQDGSDISIDEVAGKIKEHGVEAPFGIRTVSTMPELYESILNAGTSALTDYSASARQHRLYLQALRKRLGLSNADDEPCPIS